MTLNHIQDTQESIDDTLRDIIGYSTLWLMLRNKTFELPLIVNTLEDTRKKIEKDLEKQGVQPWSKK